MPECTLGRGILVSAGSPGMAGASAIIMGTRDKEASHVVILLHATCTAYTEASTAVYIHMFTYSINEAVQRSDTWSPLDRKQPYPISSKQHMMSN